MNMIIALGLDIVDVHRMIDLYHRYGERALNRLVGSEERMLFERRSDKGLFLAGRFAAKEAVIKTLAGILESRPRFSDIQILPDDTGKPVVKLPPELANELNGYRWMISITHEKSMAAAAAILIKDQLLE